MAHNKLKDLKPVAGLKKVWSLYANNNEISDLSPLAGLEKLDALDLSGNQVTDLSPLKGLKAWKYLFLGDNKLTDVKILVEMAKGDKEGDKKFAPFWKVYLSGNPLSDDAKTAQLEELKKVAKIVEFK